MNQSNQLFHDPKKLRRLVGASGLLLPTSLLLLGLILPQVCTYRSISDYYFAPFAGEIFVGFLFFIGFFLISYKGDFSYGGSIKTDDRVSTFAGLCAFSIALFPIEGYSCGIHGEQIHAFVNTGKQCSGGVCHAIDFVDFSPFSLSDTIHSFATTGYFLSLAYFSICLFTKTAPGGYISKAKKRRNTVYKITGYTLLSVIILIGVKGFILDNTQYAILWDKYAITFFLETLGLISFGIAWWVKGGGIKSLQD